MDVTFSPDAIARLAGAARTIRLREMQAALADRLSAGASIGEFFEHGRQLIEELRTLGHDLWSFDSDGEEFETWCSDWTRVDGGGLLSVTFRYPHEVEVAWREPTRASGTEAG